jgi:hypothetical protein
MVAQSMMSTLEGSVPEVGRRLTRYRKEADSLYTCCITVTLQRGIYVLFEMYVVGGMNVVSQGKSKSRNKEAHKWDEPRLPGGQAFCGGLAAVAD